MPDEQRGTPPRQLGGRAWQAAPQALTPGRR